jgi:hypothetical protein
MLKDKDKIGGEKGVSILLAVLTLSFVLSISLGVSAILMSQMKMLGEVGYSVIALYAADSGIERALLKRSEPEGIPETELPNGAKFEVRVTESGQENCPDGIKFCIKSIGEFNGVRRAIEIKY